MKSRSARRMERAVYNGGTLQIQGGISVGEEYLYLEGAGAGNGSLENVSGNNGWDGQIDFYSDTTTTIGVTAGTLTLNGLVGGGGALTKAGTGTLILNGTTAYVGETFVNAGTLQLNGSSDITSSLQISIAAGATLRGANMVGDVIVGGAISPGLSPGTLSTGSQTWEGGGSYVWEINQADGTQGADPGWDLLDVGGDLTINATPENEFSIVLTTLTLANAPGSMVNFDNTQPYTWTIATVSGNLTGFSEDAFTFDTSDFANATGGGTFSIGAIGGNINVTFTPVPEPHEHMLLFGVGLVLLCVCRRVRCPVSNA